MLNLLLVGYGKMGNIHAKSIIESKSAKLGKVQLDKGIDGVVVSSTTHSHYSIAQKIFDYKIPILIEKPLSINLEEVIYLTKESLKKKIVLQVGFIEIYNPVVNYLKNNEIKNINEVEIFRFSEPVDENRNLENVLYDLAIHDLSVFDFLFSLDNTNILSSETKIHNNRISKAEINFLSNNISVNLNVSNRATHKKRKWKITTNENLYEIDFLNKNILIGNKKNDSQLIQLEKDISSIDNQLNSFIKKIKNNFIDKEHINNIHKTHEFISLIK